MGFHNRNVLILIVALGLSSLRTTDCDNIRLPDQGPAEQQQQLQPQQIQPKQATADGHRQGKHLLDFVGLGTGGNVDPYLAKTNSECLTGELSACFKSQALGTFSEFFSKPQYFLSENARVIRLPENEYRSIEQEPYEFSTEPRAEDQEWDQMVKFALRKVEKFIKSAAIEVRVPSELTEGGRYSPRFISDDINDEIDVLEDKSSPFSKLKLKKLFIPLLIILKLFKLKLLLFLPLILGLASFKKLLGFLAIIIPGVIGYFKLCRPQGNAGGFNGNNYYSNGFPQYSAQGVGAASYNQHTHYEQYREDPHFAKPSYGPEYYGKNQFSSPAQQGGGGLGDVRFGENAQDIAYQGYSQYRNKNVE